MKKIFTLIFLSAIILCARAQDPSYPGAPAAPQNIVSAEYFFDTDPGFGNGIAITLSPGVDIANAAISLNTTGLGNGIHRLIIRARNAEGNWSVTAVREFLADFNPSYTAAPAAPANIIRAEYFVDTDPGFGNGTAIGITPATDINTLSFTVPLAGLGNGTHRIFLRSKGNEGRWSITAVKDFVYDADPPYVTSPATPGNITYAEYFFDTDPGFGNGTVLVITPGVDLVNIPINTNTSALANGNHSFFIRTFDDWSITLVQSFIKGSSLPLHFISFSAVASHEDVLLAWETENEINTSHFDVEYSNNGTLFEKAGQVQALNITGKNLYKFTHRSPAGNSLYYRLKQVDIDDKFEYSKTIKLSRNNESRLLVFPNPAGNIIQIKGVKPEETANIQVIGIDGKLAALWKANRQMQYDVSILKTGIYLLKLLKKDHTITVILFQKK